MNIKSQAQILGEFLLRLCVNGGNQSFVLVERKTDLLDRIANSEDGKSMLHNLTRP